MEKVKITFTDDTAIVNLDPGNNFSPCAKVDLLTEATQKINETHNILNAIPLVSTGANYGSYTSGMLYIVKEK